MQEAPIANRVAGFTCFYVLDGHRASVPALAVVEFSVESEGEAPTHEVYLVSLTRMNSRVLSRIFGLGGKMLKVIVDGGCTHRPQFSRGVRGQEFLNFEPSESGSEAF